MRKLDEIMNMWEKDAIIDRLEPGTALLDIPKLHQKYLKELVEHRLASRKVNFDILRTRKLKYEYYSGKMSEEDLKEHGWEPFQLRLKSDIVSYIDSDKDIITFQERKLYHDEVVLVIESIMKELHSRTFQIRDYILWEKFVNGAG